MPSDCSRRPRNGDDPAGARVRAPGVGARLGRSWGYCPGGRRLCRGHPAVADSGRLRGYRPVCAGRTGGQTDPARGSRGGRADAGGGAAAPAAAPIHPGPLCSPSTCAATPRCGRTTSRWRRACLRRASSARATSSRRRRSSAPWLGWRGWRWHAVRRSGRRGCSARSRRRASPSGCRRYRQLAPCRTHHGGHPCRLAGSRVRAGVGGGSRRAAGGGHHRGASTGRRTEGHHARANGLACHRPGGRGNRDLYLYTSSAFWAVFQQPASARGQWTDCSGMRTETA